MNGCLQVCHSVKGDLKISPKIRSHAQKRLLWTNQRHGSVQESGEVQSVTL